MELLCPPWLIRDFFFFFLIVPVIATTTATAAAATAGLVNYRVSHHVAENVTTAVAHVGGKCGAHREREEAVPFEVGPAQGSLPPRLPRVPPP